MNLQGKCREIVMARGKVTISEIQEALPGVERRQIDRAIHHLINDGDIERVRRIWMPQTAGDYCYFVPSGQTVRFSSVWDYAQKA